MRFPFLKLTHAYTHPRMHALTHARKHAPAWMRPHAIVKEEGKRQYQRYGCAESIASCSVFDKELVGNLGSNTWQERKWGLIRKSVVCTVQIRCVLSAFGENE